MTILRIASLYFLLCAVILVSAGAEPARVMRGDNTWGEGWIFLDNDGMCKIVTAGHVVRGLDGEYIRPDVKNSRGDLLTTGKPIVLSANPDIAVLPLPTVQGPSECGTGRLSDIGAVRRMENLTDATILNTDNDEVIPIAVEQTARAMDQAGGDLFTVKPIDPTIRVVEGWSGSALVDADGIIGIVFEALTPWNEAAVVRVDFIRRLMANAMAPTSPGNGSALPIGPIGIAVQTGVTKEIIHGPDQLLSQNGLGWVVMPELGEIVFSVTFNAPRQIHAVFLSLSDPGQIREAGLEVDTRAAGGDDSWVTVNNCPIGSALLQTISCSFAPRTILSVRLALHAIQATQVELTNVSVR